MNARRTPGSPASLYFSHAPGVAHGDDQPGVELGALTRLSGTLLGGARLRGRSGEGAGVWQGPAPCWYVGSDENRQQSREIWAECPYRQSLQKPSPWHRKPTGQGEWSPRVRGWSLFDAPRPVGRGVVPARAGVVPRVRSGVQGTTCGPRACGGGPHPQDERPAPEGWSPRVRGWSLRARRGRGGPRVVPARAEVVPRPGVPRRPGSGGPRSCRATPGTPDTHTPTPAPHSQRPHPPPHLAPPTPSP